MFLFVERYIHNMITETVSMRICENQVEKIGENDMIAEMQKKHALSDSHTHTHTHTVSQSVCGGLSPVCVCFPREHTQFHTPFPLLCD